MKGGIKFMEISEKKKQPKKVKLIYYVPIVLLWILLIWLASTSGKDSPKDSTQKSSNVLLKAELREADIMNGSGNAAIGTRAYIYVKKQELIDLTQDDFKEFIDKVVKDSEYNYVTIIAEDASKAILFPSSMVEAAQYGIVNVDGTLKTVFGYITLQSDGTYKYEAK